jgi:hypothetical protein
MDINGPMGAMLLISRLHRLSASSNFAKNLSMDTYNYVTIDVFIVKMWDNKTCRKKQEF